jgi:tetratricopeptide (TPR) repeat protein
MEVPDGAVQLTADRKLFKVVNERGDPSNHCSVFHDTAVAVEYIIRSPEGVIDVTGPGYPTCWVTGDTASESGLYNFLPIAVRSMREHEVATFYMHRDYFLGSVPFITADGRTDNSTQITAVVHLRKATPIIDITLDDGEPLQPLALPAPDPPPAADLLSAQTDKPPDGTESSDQPKPPPRDPEPNAQPKSSTETKAATSDETAASRKGRSSKKSLPSDPEWFARCGRFALHELSLAEDLLAAGKPAAARKEFNRARMAWTTQVDISKALPVVDNPAGSLPDDELRRFVDSRALFGVARTFLAIRPPQSDNAVARLRESLEIDPAFDDAMQLLRECGIVTTAEEFPPFTDLRLASQSFWMNDKVPWQRRLDFAEWCKAEGANYFRQEEFKEALTMYNRAQIVFAGQSSQKDVSPERKNAMAEVTTVNRLNCLACFYALGQYQQVISNADMLLEFVQRTGLSMDHYKVKCLYRKALAFWRMNMEEDMEQTIGELEAIPGSAIAVSDLRAKIEKERKSHQVEMDFLYRKMTGTLT